MLVFIKKMRTPLFSLSLRLGGAGSKFILYLYLAKHFTSDDLGVLALIIATLAIGVQVVGMELHYVNCREIAVCDKSVGGVIIRSQAILHLFSYMPAVILLMPFFYFGFINKIYFMPVCSLLLSEHLSQELIRILQFTSRQTLSALIVFIRNGLWVFAFIAALEFNYFDPSLESLLWTWFSFSFGSAILGVFFIRDYIVSNTEFNTFDMVGVFKGISRALPFFVGTVFFNLAQYSDRFILKQELSESSVGVFFFFSTLASSVSLFVTYGVSVFYGPLAIREFRNNGVDSYLAIKKKFMIRSFAFAIFAILCCLIALTPALIFVGKSDYAQYSHIFYLLIFANALTLAGDFLNLDLYVRGLDREILYSVISGVTVSTAFQVFAISTSGIDGAAYSSIFAPLVLGFFRRIFYKRALVYNPQTYYSVKV